MVIAKKQILPGGGLFLPVSLQRLTALDKATPTNATSIASSFTLHLFLIAFSSTFAQQQPHIMTTAHRPTFDPVNFPPRLLLQVRLILTF